MFKAINEVLSIRNASFHSSKECYSHIKMCYRAVLLGPEPIMVKIPNATISILCHGQWCWPSGSRTKGITVHPEGPGLVSPAIKGPALLSILTSFAMDVLVLMTNFRAHLISLNRWKHPEDRMICALDPQPPTMPSTQQGLQELYDSFLSRSPQKAGANSPLFASRLNLLTHSH